MISRLLFVGAAFMVALLLAFNKAKTFPGRFIVKSKLAKQVLRCGPDWEELKPWLEGSDIPPIPGAGNYRWKISTRSDSAQFYFNQGINTYYSFHIIESMASFKKAARFDSQSAMIYWAQALAFGPNINDYGYAASPEALAALDNARSLMEGCSPLEKALIDAMSVRYTTDSTDVNRKMLNEKYTAEMKKVYEHFPAYPDAGTLYADAMMQEHPWDLWYPDGTSKKWTPAIREVLEKILRVAPNNPGVNHYYIHVMEPSPFAYLAIPSANRLGKLTPGLSHTVHMPSHIYLRTGNYATGVSVNIEAVKKYKQILPLYSPVQNSDFLYIIHNLHMQVNNAMLGGRYAHSAQTSQDLLKSIRPDYLSIPGPMGNLVQYVYMTPTLVDVRFGKWDKLLTAAAPSESMKYATILYRFGKGMALANSSRINEAKEELLSMQMLMRDSSLYEPFTPFSPAIDGAAVAESLLSGTIALQQKKWEEAVTAFELAVSVEENMVYNEPRDWLINPKPYLGNTLLKMGKTSQAKEVFEKDLLTNKENGWSLYGIYQALSVEKRKTESLKMLARFKKAFALSDSRLVAAVY